MTERVQVAIELDGETVPAGVLYVETGRGVSSTFVHDPTYLALKGAFPLDPAFDLTAGPSHIPGLPGTFTDAAPDRWGRNLIRRRFRRQGAGRAPGEVDFLLGVTDLTRQGALRFSRDPGGPYLAEGVGVPPLVQLPRLARAAGRVARSEDTDDDLRTLLDAGSGSLGGARPKASVVDADRLAIAKFPHPADAWDVMAWEATALDLAERAGLRTPARRLLRLAEGAVLVLLRFDRDHGRRIGYQSAMSLLQASDGDQRDYLDIADAMAAEGGGVTADLKELWTRILLSVVISNTDDHLRNHGFLRDRDGWRLAPVFDLNPDPERSGRTTSIGGATTPDESVGMLQQYAAVFGLSPVAVREQAEHVRYATAGWRAVAASHGVTQTEQEAMAEAIRPEVLAGL